MKTLLEYTTRTEELKGLPHRYYPENFSKFFRTAILRNTFEWFLVIEQDLSKIKKNREVYNNLYIIV